MSHRHVVALEELVVAWRGQGPVWLPGGVAVVRREGRLVAKGSASGPLAGPPDRTQGVRTDPVPRSGGTGSAGHADRA